MRFLNLVDFVFAVKKHLIYCEKDMYLDGTSKKKNIPSPRRN